MKIFDKLAQKFNIKSEKRSVNRATNPIEENEFLTSMSKHALKLYEKQCDIKKFTKLAMSVPEDASYDERIEQLIKDGILDPFEDSVIEELAKNQDLIDDLDL